MLHRLIAGSVALAAAAALVVGTAPAGAAPVPSGKVGPHQVFGGLVNGKGGFRTPATIRMACFGPVRPGQTGHPMSGQTVEVFRPEAIPGHFGNTGSSATHIVAMFATVSPAPANPVATTVSFARYGAAEPIPTTLRLPCGGTGKVTFVPMPHGSGASDATVHVVYVGQP